MQPRTNGPRKEEASVNEKHRENSEWLGRCEGVRGGKSGG